MGDHALAFRDPIFFLGNSRNLSATRGWVAGAPMEPLTRALTLVGAIRADAGNFRSLDANSWLRRPLVGGGFQVWSPPERRARDGNGRHEWRLGVRLGPIASVELPRGIYDLSTTLPGSE